MSYILSFDNGYQNWYVSELYKKFANYFIEKHGGSVVSLRDLAKQHGELFEYREGGKASVFNPYNLVVYNTNTKKSYLHSLVYYAPALLSHTSAIEKLNISTFSFCSNFDKNLTHDSINLIPSFFILENWDDHSYIEKFRGNASKNQCYFNGLPHGSRRDYIHSLKHNNFFVMLDKTIDGERRTKEQYYSDLSQFKYGLSLNGVAKICYRDLECFGLGVLCIRENLDILTNNQLQENIHYKSVLDDYVINNISNFEKRIEVASYIEHKIKSISLEEEKYIINNARNWFDENAMPDKQVLFIENCILNNIT